MVSNHTRAVRKVNDDSAQSYASKPRRPERRFPRVGGISRVTLVVQRRTVCGGRTEQDRVMPKLRQVVSSSNEMEDTNAFEPSEEPIVASLFPSPAFGPLIERWLDLTARQDSAFRPAMRQARRLCGRWIGYRCAQLALSREHLAATVGLNADTLDLLELGLAGDDLVDECCRERLIIALAGKELNADWVAAVVEVTLGRREAQAQTIADQAAAALRVSLSE